MGSSKSTTKTATNQTQTSAPPTWTAPGLVDAAGAVTAGIGQIPTSHYTGPQVATMDPTQMAAITGAWTNTAGQATDLASWETGLLPQLTQPMSFTTALPSTSYSLAPQQDATAAIMAGIDPVMRNLTDTVLPGITNSALASGAYSGNRAMGVLPTEAIRQAQDSAERIGAQLSYEDYNNYENRRLAAYQATTSAAQNNYSLETARQTAEATARLTALGMAPDMINSILHTGASAGDLLNMAAQLEVQQAQGGINNAVGMDQYASQSPFMGLDTASALLAQLSGGYGTQNMTGTTNTTQKTTPSLASQLIQGAVGIGGMVAGFPGIGGALGLGGAAGTPAASSLFAPLPITTALPGYNA